MTSARASDGLTAGSGQHQIDFMANHLALLMLLFVCFFQDKIAGGIRSRTRSVLISGNLLDNM